MRIFNVIIGSGNYFDNQTKEIGEAQAFLDLVRLSDKSKETAIKFSKANRLLLRNDNYHGITEQANDRVGSLIYDLTTEDSIIWLHNPPFNLLRFLKDQEYSHKIELNIDIQKYDIERDPNKFLISMQDIRNKIIGQDVAIVEIGKTLNYLTKCKRTHPYVVMFYGNSSLGKTEMVRKIAENFFNNKFFEQHLSMFKSNVNSDYLFGDKSNRKSLGYDLLERESNLIFLDEFDKCADYFYSVFYTLFDNAVFKDAVYEVDISGTLIILTSNYRTEEEMKEHLGSPIYYRIDKFIHFEDFNTDTIYKIVAKELEDKYEEYKEYFTKEELYCMVSKRILALGENGRTIKNKIQVVLEEKLFEHLIADTTT